MAVIGNSGIQLQLLIPDFASNALPMRAPPANGSVMAPSAVTVAFRCYNLRRIVK
jgi:hypothetical protein